MLSTILGVLTALAVALGGLHWYRDQRAQEAKAIPASDKGRSERVPPPLVQEEEAEQFLQQQKSAHAADRSPTSEVVEIEGKSRLKKETSLAPAEQLVDLPVVEVEPAATAEASPDDDARIIEAEVAPTLPSVEQNEVDEGSEHALSPTPPPEESSVLTGLVSEDDIMGYCARCRAKRYLDNVTYTRTKRGKPAIRGNCVICGSGMLVFTSEEAWQAGHEAQSQHG